MISPRTAGPAPRAGQPRARYTRLIGIFYSLGLVLLAASVGAEPRARAGHEAQVEPDIVQEAAPIERADSLVEAARLFFNGQYDASAEMSLRLRAQAPDDLATFEQRSSALHFQLKRELSAPGRSRDRKQALRECERCQALIDAISADLVEGRRLAHAQLASSPRDVDVLFFLGKLDLTYVWLHNDTLGRRTGWGEYREARRVLEDVLEQDPAHVRARVARAFIDYVVDTRVPWAFRWVLGGGNRKRALATLREVATVPAEPGARAEARFALWEMLVRDGQIDDAAAVARELAADYPENRELQRFLAEHDS